jgi:hypothetical protein
VLFGNVNAAIPFLLDLLHIPADTFRLFVTSAIVNARFGALLAAVHTLVIAVLGTCALAGGVIVDGRKLLRYATVTMLLTAVVVGGTRVLLQAALQSALRQRHRVDRHGLSARARPGRRPGLPAITPRRCLR